MTWQKGKARAATRWRGWPSTGRFNLGWGGAGGVAGGAMVAYLVGDGSGVAGAWGGGALAALSRAALALMLWRDGLAADY